MSFTANQTGVEQDAVQVLFPRPPKILQPYAEHAKDTVFKIAVAGNPIVVKYDRTQAAAFLRLGVVMLTEAMQTTLKALADAGGIVVVKHQTGTATTLQCAWGPAMDQVWETYTGEDHPVKDRDGATLDGALTTRRAELLFLRLE